MHGKALPEELKWLHGYPQLWLRTLLMMRREVESHIAKSKIELAPFKPTRHCSKEEELRYLELKAEVDLRVQGQLHFLEIVKGRLDHVKALIGHESAVGALIVGDVVAHWIDLAEMIERGDYPAARDFANHWADKWRRLVRPATAQEQAMDMIRQRWGS